MPVGRAILVAGVMVGLVSCGGGANESGPAPPPTTGSVADEPAGAPDAGAGGDVLSTITVDGDTYTMSNYLGGRCDTDDDVSIGRDLAASGYDDETGTRVELSFTRQSAEFSPSGEEEFYGSLSLGSGSGGQWQVTSLEPWPWIDGDRSTVTGTAMMADSDGNEVEVTFDISCG